MMGNKNSDLTALIIDMGVKGRDPREIVLYPVAKWFIGRLNRWFGRKNKKMNYTNSLLVDYTLISPHKNSPRIHPVHNPKGIIDTITIHHTAGKFSIESLAAIFATKGRKASSNYGVGDDGRIALFVEEKDRSWASSSPANDYKAVTIEVVNSRVGGNWPVSDIALHRTIALCIDICQRNNIQKLNFTGDKCGNLTMHKWFADTQCPGEYLKSKFPYITDQVNQVLQLTNFKQYKQKPSSKLIEEILIGKWGNGDERKKRLEQAGYNYLVVQDEINKILGKGGK